MRGLDWAILVAGTLLAGIALTADLVGLGGFPGFGWKQVVGCAVGLALVAIGATRVVQRDRVQT